MAYFNITLLSRRSAEPALTAEHGAVDESATQNRLATGKKKVNSALDNPVNFFTSSSLHARANDSGAPCWTRCPTASRRSKQPTTR